MDSDITQHNVISVVERAVGDHKERVFITSWDNQKKLLRTQIYS